MMGRQVEQAALFYEFSLERHVPANHLLRAIDRFVELGALRSELAAFYSNVGRPSIDPDDLFHAHIGGMDAFARGLKVAAAIRKDGRLEEFVRHRYRSWDGGVGKKIEEGKVGFRELETYALKMGDVTTNESGRQEYLENLINEFV